MASTTIGSNGDPPIGPDHPAYELTDSQRSDISKAVRYDSIGSLLQSFFGTLSRYDLDSKIIIPSLKEADFMLRNDQDFANHLEEILVTRNCFDILKHGQSEGYQHKPTS